MASVKDIISAMHTPSPEDAKLVEKAYSFAENAHKDHKRFSGEPYFNHLYETAKSLAELGFGPRTVSAGLLHDSIEDVGITEEQIQKEFGEEILFLIRGVTKLGHLKYRGLERHTESLRRLMVATSQDIRVLLIKLMDRLHNMKTLDHVPKDKQKRIALETLEIFAPIAHRLGMGLLRRELEDLSFKYVYPEEYEETDKLRKDRAILSTERLAKVLRDLKKQLAKNNIREFKTDYRIKGLFSLYRKLERKGGDIDKIYDLAALRIIVPTVEDCYKVLGIVHANWRPLPNKIKDYIAFPKPNGYQSIHTTVFTGEGSLIEIQIRTEKMHQEAEYGIASHVLYKELPEGGKERQSVNWLRSLIPFVGRKPPEAQVKKARKDSHSITRTKYSLSNVPRWVDDLAEVDEAGQGKEFMDKLKTDFFSHRVFAFTPKGDVVDLPVGAFPVDFAYAIHSDIGNHLTGAKVNGKLVSLDTVLHNGDIVEIMTKDSAHPNAKWLEVAKTSMAQKHIRAALAKKEPGKS